MGQATSFGGMLLVSMLSLACNHERVDLGGTGASGPAQSSVAGAASPFPSRRQAPAPDLAGTLAAPILPPQPMQVSVIRPTAGRRPSPLSDLTSRSELLPPISGGSLAVAADGSSAVAADPDRDALYLIDLPSSGVRMLQLPAGSEPGRVVLDDEVHGYALLRGTGKLARVQLKTGMITLSEPICQYPRGLAYSSASRTLHVACADGQLVKLSADTLSVSARERHLTDLRDVVMGPMDTRVVSRFRSASLLWQGQAGEFETQPLDLPRPKVDLSAPSDAQVSSVSTRARLAFRTVAAADGTLWMLHERAQLDALQDDVYGGADPFCGAVIQIALTQFSGFTEPGELSSLELHKLAAPAVDFAISPDSFWIAVATPAAYAQNRPSVQLHLLDTLKKDAQIRRESIDNEFQNSPSEVCRPPVFFGLAEQSQAVAVAFDRNNVLYIQNRFPARLHIVQLSKAGSTSDLPSIGDERRLMLNDTDVRDLGHEWFHAEIGESKLSCAACHAEGLDDAHTWQSSTQGLRRTPSLRGGLLQTAPFAWDGEFGSADALITHILQDRLDAYDVPTTAVVAMAAWLDRLPALSLQSAPAADSGKVLFESPELGCSTCHSGPQLTNNQTLDVGSGGAFQVPSLLGLGLRAPYMHDGCAADLNALFTQPECARQGHAQLAELSAEQAADLRAYLEAL